MQIVFNGDRVEIDPDISLKKFLESKNFASQGVAASCDDEIIPKSQWDSFILKEGMKLDVFSLVAGG